jgi:hypothetical protein
MIEVKCPSCGKSTSVPDEYAGRKGRCKDCKAAISVPRPVSAEAVEEMELAAMDVVEEASPPPPRVVHQAPMQGAVVASSVAAVQPARAHVHVEPEPEAGNSKIFSAVGIVAVGVSCIAVLVCWLFGAVAGLPVAAAGLMISIFGTLLAIVGKKFNPALPVVGGIAAIMAFCILIETGRTAFASALGSQGQSGGSIQDIAAQADAPPPAAPAQAAKPSPAPPAQNASPQPPQPPAPAPPAAEQSAQPDLSVPSNGGTLGAVSGNWESAASPVKFGLAEVTLKPVIGKVSVLEPYSGRTGDSQERELILEIDIKNVTAAKKIEFTSWAKGGTTTVTVEDEIGNVYKPVDYGFYPVGHTESGSIYPGKSIKDVLIFEQPVDAARELRVSIPSENWGGAGTLKLTFPTKNIGKGK